jgi:hypothetical protein
LETGVNGGAQTELTGYSRLAIITRIKRERMTEVKKRTIPRIQGERDRALCKVGLRRGVGKKKNFGKNHGRWGII